MKCDGCSVCVRGYAIYRNNICGDVEAEALSFGDVKVVMRGGCCLRLSQKKRKYYGLVEEG